MDIKRQGYDTRFSPIVHGKTVFSPQVRDNLLLGPDDEGFTPAPLVRHTNRPHVMEKIMCSAPCNFSLERNSSAGVCYTGSPCVTSNVQTLALSM